MSVPYWRLSTFYFVYFLVVGANLPFWNLYLQSLQFTPEQIGITAAIITVTKILSPNIWAWLSNRTGQRLLMIRVGAILGSVIYAGIFLNHSFVWIVFIACGFSFFWNAIFAQFEVITLAHLEGQTERYGQIRLWGSISFIVTVMALGLLFDYVSIGYFPVLVFIFLVLIALSSFTVSDHRYPKKEASISGFFKKLRHKHIIGFFIACLCLEMSIGAYYTFFSIYLESFGYSRSVIGLLWALSVIVEVGIFLITHKLLVRIGIYRLFIFSIVATAVRWVLLAEFVEVFPILLFSQVLHAFTYGTAHAACVEWIRRNFQTDQGHALAFYGAVGFGIGGGLGALLSGYLWTWSSQAAFLLSALIAGLGALIAWFYWKGKEAA